ncbi:ornithine cyclodeaminase family protein [soil metagenome]|jgi:ornithine cyclodeaminase
MRIIGAVDLKALVPMVEAVDLMKQVFAQYSQGQTISPIRTPVQLPDGSGVSLYMPAYVSGSNDIAASLGAKIVSVFPGNAQRDLPTINAIVIALNPETGEPVGLIEGAAVTALRTGAVSGAATDFMARSDSSVLTIIGAGAQGVTQAAGVCSVRRIKEIRVVDPSQQATASFAARLSSWIEDSPALIHGFETAEQALEGTDIVCTATTSRTPIFDDNWIQPGTHINGVGAFTPDMQEIPDATVARARIVVDAVEAILHEAGDIIQPLQRGVITESQIQTELGHLVLGSAAGRENPDQLTFFKSVGNAIQDMIVASAALKAAESRGVGQTVSLA